MDGRAYLDVNRFARDTAWAHGVVSTFALWAGLVILALLLIGAWWWIARRRPDAPRAVTGAFLAGASAVVALGVNQVISQAVARPRPFLHYPHAEVLLPRAHDYSFPSDHAVVAGALVVGLWLLNRRLGAAAAVIGLLLAFARVYVGVHYPTDVLAGLAIGGATGALCHLLLRRPFTALARGVAHGGLRPLVTSHPVAVAPHGSLPASGPPAGNRPD